MNINITGHMMKMERIEGEIQVGRNIQIMCHIILFGWGQYGERKFSSEQPGFLVERGKSGWNV